MAIALRAEHEAAMRAHAERDYPHECCGLLLGKFEADGVKRVVETMPISNAREEEARRRRFLIRPEELLAGERRARQQGLEIVGFYHSHPDHPAVPSSYDLEHALPVYSYIIVAVERSATHELRSWQLRDDRSQFDEEEILKGV
ncbi:MAG: hypothetical protein C4334_01220 [Pyrinomonas sp.]|uniref:M67 family metallopeptidase n=1 Tax=Pyrinomonas sp. TaxID=2080306 RepID=UPI0033184E24